MGNTETGSPEEQPPDPRGAWSPARIAIAAVLLSPLPGAVLHGLNYGRLGRPDLRRSALISNVCGALMILGIAIFFRFAAVANLFYAIHFQRSQSSLFEAHLARGGKQAKLLRPALGWFLCTVGPLVAIAGLIDSTLVNRRFDRAVAMVNEGRLDEAEPIFLEFLESEPDNPWPRWNLAVIEDRRGNPEQAAEHIRSLIREHPDFDRAPPYLKKLEQCARFDHGLDLIHEGRLDEAEPIFLEFLESEPENPWPRWNLAVIEDRRGNLSKAADHVRVLMGEHPDFDRAPPYLRKLEQRARFAHGVDLLNGGSLDEAEEIFQEHLKLVPEEQASRYNLALIHERRGDPEGAIAQLRILVKEHPDYGKAVEYLDRLEKSRR